MKDHRTDELIERYLKKNCGSEPELLIRLSRETRQKTMKPRMLSGHVQGRFLSLVSYVCRPRFILEIGTFTGYSALCLAEGLQPEGRLITLESNPEYAELAKKYIDESPLSPKITLLQGRAAELIPSLNMEFDLVFMDADKINNRLYFDQVFPKVTSGGLILVDNVLWDGKVAFGEKDLTTLAIHEFNEYISSHPGLQHMILPLRDGIHIIVKN